MSKNIIVGFDARTVFSPERRGIGKSLMNLYRHLAAMRPQWKFIAYYENENVQNPFNYCGNIIPRFMSIRGYRWDLWQNLLLPVVARFDGVNLLHCPAQYGPWFKLMPTVLTMHDIIPLRFVSNKNDHITTARRLRRSWNLADAVMTVSEYSKRDIIDYFQCSPEKISVINWAPEDESRIVYEIQHKAIREQYGTGECYLFTFGATDPRKNTLRVIRAFARWKNGGGKGRLVISGIQQEHEGPFREVVECCGLEKDVVFCGFVPDAVLPALLSGASCLVFASLYEGFGIPLLDAMVCGVPIIASQSTSLPEVAADAALYCDPESDESIAEAMGRVMGSEELRFQLIKAGFDRVKEFTWDRTAGRVLEIFEKVLLL